MFNKETRQALQGVYVLATIVTVGDEGPNLPPEYYWQEYVVVNVWADKITLAPVTTSGSIKLNFKVTCPLRSGFRPEDRKMGHAIHPIFHARLLRLAGESADDAWWQRHMTDKRRAGIVEALGQA